MRRKIEILLQYSPWFDETELRQMTVAELDELIDDRSDDSDMYPKVETMTPKMKIGRKYENTYSRKDYLLHLLPMR